MTTNRHNIPKGRANAIIRIQLARLWSCSDRAARYTLANFHTESSDDSCDILSIPSEPAEHQRLHNPAEIMTFLAKTDVRAYNTLHALREAWRGFGPPNYGGQNRIDNSV